MTRENNINQLFLAGLVVITPSIYYLISVLSHNVVTEHCLPKML